MTWTPETNLIITDLLTEEQKKALRAAKHGLELWNYHRKEWVECGHAWTSDTVCRAKTAPKKRIVVWLHANADGAYPASTEKREVALGWLKKWGGWIKRIECDVDGSNMTVTDEVL